MNNSLLLQGKTSIIPKLEITFVLSLLVVVSEKVFFINESFWVDDNRSVLSEDETVLLKNHVQIHPYSKTKVMFTKLAVCNTRLNTMTLQPE